MNNKPIDRTKKSNIKCEHCVCDLTDEYKDYWSRCKLFERAESEVDDTEKIYCDRNLCLSYDCDTCPANKEIETRK